MVGNILLYLLMITHKAVQSISSDINQNSEVLEKFKEFKPVITVDSGQRVGILLTDNDGEYLSNEFKACLKSKGICHELTVS